MDDIFGYPRYWYIKGLGLETNIDMNLDFNVKHRGSGNYFLDRDEAKKFHKIYLKIFEEERENMWNRTQEVLKRSQK